VLTAGRLGLLASCTNAWQACAINSVTINSTGYVPGQSGYSRQMGGNGLLGYTVPFTLIQTGKYRTEVKLQTHTIHKLNTTQKKSIQRKTAEQN